MVNVCVVASPPLTTYTSNSLAFYLSGMPVINDISKVMYNLRVACQCVISQQIFLREASITETHLQRGFRTQFITQSARLTAVTICQHACRILTYYISFVSQLYL